MVLTDTIETDSSTELIDAAGSPSSAGRRIAASWVVQNRAGSTRSPHVEVLALDAAYRQALASMRSLGRLGIEIGAVACRAEASWAPALRSRWSALNVIVPNFDDQPDEYVTAILELLDEYPARLILPSHDGSIQALRSRRAEVERRTFLPLASEAALDIAVSKQRTLSLGAELGLAVPRSVLVTDERDVRAALNELGCPAVIKPLRSWGESDGRGTRLGADSVSSVDEALRALVKIQTAGLKAMFQQWLPGRRDAVSFFRTSGKTWARFAQTSYREFPPIGGNSVLFESIPLLPELVRPAEALVEAAGLDGCSMVEFRRDTAGRPVLMEINARMAGSVALAMSAGIDYPKMIYTWALGKPLWETGSYRVGRRQRWVSGDIWHLKCVFESRGRPDTPSRTRAVAIFLADFLRRPSALDFWEPTDPRPGLAELHHGLIDPIVGRISRSATELWRRTPERIDESNEH